MRITRRGAVGALLAAPLSRPFIAMAGVPRITIASASAAGPHAAVVDGMRRVFSAKPIASSTFQVPADDSALSQELKNGSSQLAIAVGINALRSLSASKTRIPLLTTMSFRADLKSSGILDMPDVHLAGVVWLDLSVQQIIAGLRLICPDVNRIAVIQNPSQAEALGQSHQPTPGVTVHAVGCASASDLLPALRKLKGQVDFVVCLPDSALYNKTTVEPLILSSLELRLPLVGFSLSFVKAGAAVGVFPDFADVGRQTAVLAERCLEGSAATREEPPHKTTVAANQRVLHLLGRDYRGKGTEEVVEGNAHRKA